MAFGYRYIREKTMREEAHRKRLPKLLQTPGSICEKQNIDRQFRRLLIDGQFDKNLWADKAIEQFWRELLEQHADHYSDLAKFMLHVLALPQSTAEVERTFFSSVPEQR